MTDPDAAPVVEELDGSSGPEVVTEVLGVIRAAFGARPPLDPPAPALAETEASVAAALAADGGLLARAADGRPLGALLLRAEGDTMRLRRVSVRPGAQGRGVAGRLRRAAEELAARRGLARVRAEARSELPGTVRFWEAAGYAEVTRSGTSVLLAKALPVALEVATAEEMRDLGRRLARVLRAGDVVVLSGDLGAGKTTLTQGLGAGLGVRGEVTSPTFVISRVHPALREGPALVHVDAYRLAGLAELDDLDLDVSLEESVTVVEWGAGIAERLADARLEVTVTRARGEHAGEARQVRLRPVGPGWAERWPGDGLQPGHGVGRGAGAVVA